MNRGGSRWWLLCPRCKRRIAQLQKAPRLADLSQLAEGRTLAELPTVVTVYTGQQAGPGRGLRPGAAEIVDTVTGERWLTCPRGHRAARVDRTSAWELILIE